MAGNRSGTLKVHGSPLDCKSRDSGLLSQHIPPHSLDDRFGGRLGVQLVRVVLIVDIITHTHELPSVIAAGQQYDGDAEDFGRRDAFQVGGVGFEDEFVDADWDGPNEEGVEFLIMFGAVANGLVVVYGRGWKGSYEVAEPT